MAAKITVVVCLLSAAATMVLGAVGRNVEFGLDVKRVAGCLLWMLIYIWPYVMFALLAQAVGDCRWASWLLLVLVTAASVLGPCILGQCCYRYHTDPEYRQTEAQLAVFAVPLIQWPAMGLAGLVTLICGRRRPGHSPEARNA